MQFALTSRGLNWIMQFAEDDCTVTRAVATLVQSSNIPLYEIRRRFALHELVLAEKVRDCVHQIDVSH
jgi:hypothetical protein